MASAITLNKGKFATDVAQAAAQVDSGVRHRWVELPNCDSTGPLTAGDVALKEDLSNAVIATCKSYTFDPNATAPQTLQEQPLPTPPSAEYEPKPIYDPVMHEVDGPGAIPSHEHQVTQHQNGTVEATTGIAESPAGDFERPVTVDAGEQWEDQQPLEPVTTLPAGTASEALVGVSVQDMWAPEDTVVLQMQKKGKMVELPDCVGDDGEIALTESLDNTTVATCKTRADDYDTWHVKPTEAVIPVVADADLSYKDQWDDKMNSTAPLA